MFKISLNLISSAFLAFAVSAAAAPKAAFFDSLDAAAAGAPPERTLVNARGIEFTEGKIGGCAHIVSEKSSVRYPPDLMPWSEGSVEMWLRFDETPSGFKKARRVFLCFSGGGWHENSVEFFLGGQDEWGAKLLFMICDKTGKRFTISRPVTDWKAGQWRHVALTWRVNLPGESSMALYLDYKLEARLDNETITLDENEDGKSNQGNGAGFVWLNPGGAQAGFSVDEFRIYRLKRDYN
jgi:hypothetical protein